MRVGDMLVSVDGKDVLDATLQVALSTIETARRRVSDRTNMHPFAQPDVPDHGNIFVPLRVVATPFVAAPPFACRSLYFARVDLLLIVCSVFRLNHWPNACAMSLELAVDLCHGFRRLHLCFL